MINRKTHSKQSSSDSESSTIIPVGIEEFMIEPRTPVPMGSIDTASVPDPSPVKSAFSPDSQSDAESSPDTPTRSFIHQRRRRHGEYHYRPPVWIIQPFKIGADDSQQVSQGESCHDMDPFSLDLGQLAAYNQLNAMASNINSDPIVVGMVQQTNDENENNRSTTHQNLLPTTQSPFELSRFSSDSVSLSSSEYHCVPSTTPCEKCPEWVICEHCGRCENCLGETQKCPNWMQSKRREPVCNETKGQDSKFEVSNDKEPVRSLPLSGLMSKSYTGSSPPLRTISNTVMKDSNRKFTLHAVDLANADVIAPAPAQGPSQDKLSSEEKIRIGQIITKLPKDLTDQVNLIIRKMMPEAKSSYNTVMDVICLPEDVLISLQDWLRKRSELVTASSSQDSHQKAQSSKSDINDASSPIPDENGPRCIARCKDIRVRNGAYAIEAGSQVICVGCTEASTSEEGEFMFQKGQVFTVIQVFGDHWAACIKGNLQGAFRDEDVDRCETMYNEKYCVIRKDNPNIGFLPLCAVTLISNYAHFLADTNGAGKETKPWNGLTLSAPKRVQSLKAQHEWADFMEVTIPHSHCVMHKASPCMKDANSYSEPFDQGIDEKRSNPCAFYQRNQDCDNESSGATLTRKAVQQFQKAKGVFSRQDERDVVERKLKRRANGATRRMSLSVPRGRMAGSREKGKLELPGEPNAALGDLPSPRDSQIGPINQSEQPVVDNMMLRDPGNLLPHDPAARYRHADGLYWPIVEPRAMSVDEPTAMGTDSWGRVMGRRMVTAGRELSSGFFKSAPSWSRGVRRMASWARPSSSGSGTKARLTEARQSGPENSSPSSIPEVWNRPHSRLAGSGSGGMPAMSGGGATLPTIVSPDHFVRTPWSDNHEESPPEEEDEGMGSASGDRVSGVSQ